MATSQEKTSIHWAGLSYGWQGLLVTLLGLVLAPSPCGRNKIQVLGELTLIYSGSDLFSLVYDL
jgi:hypothetical protein